MPDTLELRRLGEALGTEALGVDLSRLDDATFDRISEAFAEHPVLVFRDQKLGAADIGQVPFGDHEHPADVSARHCGPSPGLATSAPASSGPPPRPAAPAAGSRDCHAPSGSRPKRRR